MKFCKLQIIVLYPLVKIKLTYELGAYILQLVTCQFALISSNGK